VDEISESNKMSNSQLQSTILVISFAPLYNRTTTFAITWGYSLPLSQQIFWPRPCSSVLFWGCFTCTWCPCVAQWSTSAGFVTHYLDMTRCRTSCTINPRQIEPKHFEHIPHIHAAQCRFDSSFCSEWMQSIAIQMSHLFYMWGKQLANDISECNWGLYHTRASTFTLFILLIYKRNGKRCYKERKMASPWWQHSPSCTWTPDFLDCTAVSLPSTHRK